MGRATGEGFAFIKEMVENERGTFAAGYRDGNNQWVVVISIPLTARYQ